MDQILHQILENLIPAMIGGGAGWFFHRQKSKAEIKGMEADNNGKIVGIYQEALDDLKKRYEERFNELQKEVDLLRRNVELWKGKYRDLKKEFEDYKNNVNRISSDGK